VLVGGWLGRKVVPSTQGLDSKRRGVGKLTERRRSWVFGSLPAAFVSVLSLQPGNHAQQQPTPRMQEALRLQQKGKKLPCCMLL